MKAIKVLLIALTIAFVFIGCKNPYKGGKIIEGTDAFVGFNVPLSEGTVQFELLNYLSGFRFAYDKDAIIECEYCISNETEFAGIYDNRVYKNFKVKMTPIQSVTNNVLEAFIIPNKNGGVNNNQFEWLVTPSTNEFGNWSIQLTNVPDK